MLPMIVSRKLALLLSFTYCCSRSTLAWLLCQPNGSRTSCVLLSAKAGTFFNPVPDDEERHESSSSSFEADMEELLRRRKAPSKASHPSTGVPTAGFGKPLANNKGKQLKQPPPPPPPQKFVTTKPFIGIGPPANDVTKPQTDDQGYTLYTNEQTGEKSRVFEALVEYPCEFTMKIVGANEGSFVTDVVATVAASCQVDTVHHTVRQNGKWLSVTVQAPVQSAAMLYQLYERVDQDPRVKFKF